MDKHEDKESQNSTCDCPEDEKVDAKGLWALLELEAPCKKPPKLGMRAIKTAIVVGLILLVYALWAKIWPKREDGTFLAIIGGIVAMQDTVGHSLRSGLIRIFATAWGGLMGILFTLAVFACPAEWRGALRIAAMVLGTLLCIYMGNWLNFRQGIVICIVVLLAILITDERFTIDGAMLYALNRVLDTMIGIVLSVIVNLAIRPPKWQ